ncbi:MAG: riboflavin synthase [Verrucomicrobia bacterium]|nr:riboflavin synthase [Verrucomicrobiota bacterium]
MFTGLVQATGKVIALDKTAQGGVRLQIESTLFEKVSPGASIAVNGCCLTVTDPLPSRATFDLLGTTLSLTNLGNLKIGSLVNLEPSVRPTDPMGGHFVTGHIDACGTILFWGPDGADWRLDIKAPPTITRYLVTKGCIAVDGMSLTVAELLPEGFRIWIIPHTLEVTNLAQRISGDRVNLETDLLAKYTEKLLAKS